MHVRPSAIPVVIESIGSNVLGYSASGTNEDFERISVIELLDIGIEFPTGVDSHNMIMLVHSFSCDCLRSEMHSQNIEVEPVGLSIVSRLFQEHNDVQLDLHRQLLKQRELLKPG